MFTVLSWDHLLVLGVVALAVVKRTDLPLLLNAAPVWASAARRKIHDLFNGFSKVSSSSELDALRDELNGIKRSILEVEFQAQPKIIPRTSGMIKSSNFHAKNAR